MRPIIRPPDPEVQDVDSLNSIGFTYGSPEAPPVPRRGRRGRHDPRRRGRVRVAAVGLAGDPRARGRARHPAVPPRRPAGRAHRRRRGTGRTRPPGAARRRDRPRRGRGGGRARRPGASTSPRSRRSRSTRWRRSSARSGSPIPGVDIALADPGDARRASSTSWRAASASSGSPPSPSRARAHEPLRSAARTCSRCSRPGATRPHAWRSRRLAALPARHRAGRHHDPHASSRRRSPTHGVTPTDRGRGLTAGGDPPARARGRRRDPLPPTARRAGGAPRCGGRARCARTSPARSTSSTATRARSPRARRGLRQRRRVCLTPARPLRGPDLLSSSIKLILFIKLLHNCGEATRGPMRPASVNDEWGEMSREHFDERCRP